MTRGRLSRDGEILEKGASSVGESSGADELTMGNAVQFYKCPQ
jgi:hypothetical protein